MTYNDTDLLQAIANFDPSVSGWLAFDDLLERLFTLPAPEAGIPALFHLLERFPEETGYGVLWGVVHTLEYFSGYETFLLESVRQQPTELTVAMLNRLLNVGISAIGETRLIDLLAEVSSHPAAPPSVRQDARNYLEKHQGP